MIGRKFVSVFKRPTIGPSLRGLPTTGQFASSKAITVPTNNAGDMLVCYYSVTSGDAGNANGWTRNLVAASLSFVLYCSTKVSAGNDTTSPLVSNQVGVWTCYVIKDSSGIVDANSSGDNGNAATSAIASSISPIGSNDVLISAYAHNSGIKSITVPVVQTESGLVTETTSTTYSMNCGSETLAASGATGTRTATLGANTSWAAASIAIK